MPDLPPLPPPGGTSGGSSSGSSGGSSGGGSSSGSSGGTSAPQTQAQVLAERRAQRAIEELRRSYLEVLRRWGLRPNKNLLNLVEKGIRGAWSSTTFIAMLRQTPEYRKQFRGIQWRTGMTEGQYLSTFAQYKARAQDIGEHLTRQEFGKMLKRGVEFDEFSDRVDALAAIDEFSPLWQQMKFELEQSGVSFKGGTPNKKELSKVLMRIGSELFEKLYERAFVTTNLERVAGIDVVERGKGETAVPDTYGISRKDMLKIIGSVEALSPGFEVESLTGQDWAQIGSELREFDFEYMRRYGLTTKEYLNAKLGGPGAAKGIQKAKHVQETQEAFFDPRAIPQESQQVGQVGKQREELPQSL